VRLHLFGLLLLTGGFACTAATPLYCDDQTPCATGMHCDRVHNRCLSDDDSNVDPDVPMLDAPVADAVVADLQAAGTGCVGSSQCASGHCVDDVCCDTACAGLCVACGQTGTVGTCTPIPSGSDPDDECAGWPESASCDVTCNGSGGCVTPEKVCVTTLAGNGLSGYLDGIGVSTQFSAPRGVGRENSSSVLVADTGNHAIRRISNGQTTTDYLFKPGIVKSPTAVTEFGPFALVVADQTQHRLRTGVGTVSTLVGTGQPGFVNGPLATAQLSSPYALATSFLPSSLLLVGDAVSVRQIVDDQLSVVAGTGVAGFKDGWATQAQMDRVQGLAFGAGAIYVVEQESHRIRTIVGGVVATVAGNGVVGCLDGPAASATIDSPGGIAVDSTGRVFFTDCGRLRMLDHGTVSTVAGSSFGNADGFGSTAQFSSELGGLVLLTSTKICIADTGNHSIRLVWLH